MSADEIVNSGRRTSLGDEVVVHGLVGRADLNDHAARVCKLPRADGRVGVEMLHSQERVWVKSVNFSAKPRPIDHARIVRTVANC